MGQPMQWDALAAWCEEWLGSRPVRTLFESGHLSVVVGLGMADGRDVVVKARPPEARLAACVAVQRHLWAAGFPCPQPLVGPVPLGALTATAEMLVPGGEQLPPGPERPRRFAAALARLVALAPPVAALPTLDPAPAWVGWDHDQPGTWPAPDDSDADLNAFAGPPWLDECGRRVRARLLRCRQPPIVGHADWESQNLRWRDGELYVAHDWDSVAARPEVALAGATAAVFTASGAPLTEATPGETASFLDAYEQARGRAWDDDEREVCWAAGLWVLAFNAKKAAVAGSGEAALARLASEVDERLCRAGA